MFWFVNVSLDYSSTLNINTLYFQIDFKRWSKIKSQTIETDRHMVILVPGLCYRARKHEHPPRWLSDHEWLDQRLFCFVLLLISLLRSFHLGVRYSREKKSIKKKNPIKEEEGNR